MNEGDLRRLGSVAVVVAHPDDEIIGAGALLQTLSNALVVHVTDGAPRDGEDARRAGCASPAEYARLRRAEALEALGLAGLGAERVHELGVADQRASYELAPLARRLADEIEAEPLGALLTHAYEGGHPDHDATAFAVHAAVALLGRRGGVAPLVFELGGYNRQGGVVRTLELIPKPDAPVWTHALAGDAAALKRRMLACFRSQAATLAPFPVDREVFRRAPKYHFTAPPSPEPVHYDSFGWGITGVAWREQARVALEALELEEPL